MATKASIRRRLPLVIKDYMQTEAEPALHDTFESINADRLDIIELVLTIEDEFKIEVPASDEQAFSELTFEQMVSAISRLSRGKQCILKPRRH